MNMHELHNNLKYSVGLAPVAAAPTDNTAQATGVIDMQGYASAEVVMILGTLADADATFAIAVTHCDAANLSDSAAAPSECIMGDASFTFADDGVIKKVGIVPAKGAGKRYWKVTVTPSNNTGNFPIAMVVVQQPLTVPAS